MVKKGDEKFVNSDLRLYRVETVTLLSLKFFEFSLNNKYILIKYTIHIYF